MSESPKSSVEAIIAQGEAASREFKSGLADTRRIVETVAAMATIGGGSIVIGVRDDGRVVGAEIGEGEI